MSGSEPSDADLIRDSLVNPEAFRQLFERHYDPVRRFCQRTIGLDAGEEVAAQTFLVALERRDTYDVSRPSAKPWLFGIAHNLLRHHLRSERYRREALARISFERGRFDVLDPDTLEAARLVPLVLRTLQMLRKEDREPFVLVGLGELTYKEAAQVLGVPIGTIRSRTHRARIALRELLSEVVVIPDEAEGAGTGRVPGPTNGDA